MITNYSKCPFKKRPVHFKFDDSEIKDEPENLCIKKDTTVNNNQKNYNDKKFSNNHNERISSSVIIPTPTYPKLSIDPFNFHLSTYPQNFHVNHHHHHHQHQQHHQQQNYHHQYLSPIRSDFSPSSPSEGSLSPPPHYLHGRGNSISPPVHEIYQPLIGFRHQHHQQQQQQQQQHNNHHIIRPEVVPTQRFLPYPIRYHPHQSYPISAVHHHNHQHQAPPISPTYSEASSHYSLRSHTPESNCSSVPEDLSLKQISSSALKLESDAHNDDNNNSIIDPSPVVNGKEKISPPRFQCPDCNKSYSTFSGLTKHQQFHCPAAEGNQVKKSFSCKDCDKTYVSLGALKMHIRTHTLPCKCTFCGKAFSRPWLLQGHIRTHTGEKPFSCQHCNRAFADRSNLRAHLQTHSDIKKYSCTTCSKTFSRMSLLTKHNESGCPGING